MLEDATAPKRALPVVREEAAGLVIDDLERLRSDLVDAVDPTHQPESQPTTEVDHDVAFAFVIVGRLDAEALLEEIPERTLRRLLELCRRNRRVAPPRIQHATGRWDVTVILGKERRLAGVFRMNAGSKRRELSN